MKQLVCVYKSDATPFPLGIVASTHTQPMLKSIGLKHHYSCFYTRYQNGNGSMYLDKTEIAKLSKLVLERLERNPELVKKCRQNYFAISCKAIKLLNFSTLPKRLNIMADRKLALLLKKILDLLFNASLYAEPPGFCLELGGQTLVKTCLEAEIKKTGQPTSKSQLENLFSTLTAFSRTSFTQRAELSLFNTALAPKSKHKRLLKKYVNNFYWLSHDYYGPILDTDQAFKELKPLLKLGRSELFSRKRQIIRQTRENTLKQKLLIKKYGLSKKLRLSLRILREFGYLYSDIKKENTSKINTGLTLIIKELSKRVKIKEELLHFATVQELANLLLQRKINISALRVRKNKSVFFCNKNTTYYKFLNNTQQTKLQSKLNSKGNNTRFALKGQSACSGIYKGRVKIINNSNELNKIQRGEVLVTTMTTVSFLPAMKIAGAIVTDIGGITSHAAIVSRELNIPCVIGAENASKILKDGDLVEVNANHGIVKKL